MKIMKDESHLNLYLYRYALKRYVTVDYHRTLQKTFHMSVQGRVFTQIILHSDSWTGNVLTVTK